MLKPSSLAKWGVAVLLMSSLSSCEDIFEKYFPKPNPTPPTIPTFPPLGQDIAFYALAGGNRLDAYNTSNAATRTSSVAITGLGSGETILAIDFRPATGQLYGISSASRLYVINQNTGVARAIGAGPFSPAVRGNLVGFDFNPTVDRIRLVTSTGQNLRLNPETGTVAATDGVLNGAAGATITGAAYTNNVAGATTTVLYDLDPATDQLYRQDPPNNGTLVSVGSLNLNLSGDGGFDIDAKTGTALGLYTVNGNPTLFTVDLSTGAARPLAQYAASTGYTGLAIPTQPVAYYTEFDVFRPQAGINFLVIRDLLTGTNSERKQIRVGGNIRLIGIDFRPATGQLYAVGTPLFGMEGIPTEKSELYTINTATAEATLVATLDVRISDGPAGVDFDPVTDRLRITSAITPFNVLVNPADGTTVVGSRPNPNVAGLLGAAYSNNFAGATTSTLYAIGTESPNFGITRLYSLSDPNTGTVRQIKELGIPSGGNWNFDIGGTTNTGYAQLGDALYTIDLTSGDATRIGAANLGWDGFAVGLGF